MTLATRTEVLAALAQPVDPRHHRTRKQGGKTLTYLPWHLLFRCLQHRAPGFQWELREVQEVGDFVAVTGRLTVPCSDGDLSWDSVASESLVSVSFAHPVEVAAFSALRRAAALALLGLELYDI